jgi:hypothetical protein
MLAWEQVVLKAWEQVVLKAESQAGRLHQQ